MRNLKRALSLAMASVMTLGMMTVGASAKGLADFSDAAEITNADAVAVTSAVGIFKGYDDGEFKGKNVVTRAEMAVICAKLLYGADVDPAQFVGTATFTDTPAWAEGYINLCASLGIIAGRGNGIFDPSATVSTVEAASMLTKTLGYFKNQKDYGTDWKLAVTAKATQLGLYGDLKLAADTGLTRDNVAELVFNTMTKAVPVQYNDLLGVYYNNNQGIIYALEFNYLQTLGYKNFDLVYKTVEDTAYGRPATIWGTGHYSYTSNAEDDKDGVLDANGGLISSSVRMLDKDEIITIAQTPDYVFTDEATHAEVYKALGSKLMETTGDSKYAWYFYEDGHKAVKGDKLIDDEARDYDDEYNVAVRPDKDNDDDAYMTAKGAVLEVYIDDATQEVTLCKINYYLGEVQNLKSDEDGEYVNIKTLSEGGKILDSKKFYTEDFKKKDLVVFTVDEDGSSDTKTNFHIETLATPATVSGEVTRVEDEDVSDNTYVRLNGESTKYFYTHKDHNVYDLADGGEQHPDLKEDYIFYLTPAGYILGFEPMDEVVTKYLYVKDSDEEMKDWIAKVILSDASSAKVEVDEDLDVDDATVEWIADNGGDDADKIDWVDVYDKDDTTNIDERIWKYSVNDKGVYSLTWVESQFGDEWDINNGKSYMEESDDKGEEILVDEDTIFVDTMNDKAYVGYSAVPNVEKADIEYVLDDDGVAQIVYILEGDIYDKDSTYFMLNDTDHDTRKHDGDRYREYFYAYVNGDQKTLNIAYDALETGALEEGVLYKAVKTIDEEFITKVEVVKPEESGKLAAVGNNAFRLSDDGINSNTVKYDTDSDTVFVIVEGVYKKTGEFKKWSISEGDIADLKEIKEEYEDALDTKDDADDDFDYNVRVIESSKNTAELVYVIVAEEAEVDDVSAVLPANSAVKGVEVDKPDVLKDGDPMTVILTGGYDNVAKAAGAFEAGKVYTVVINGQTCYGVGIAGNKCVVIYFAMPSDIHGELVLKIGTVEYQSELTAEDLDADVTEVIDEVIDENGKLTVETEKVETEISTESSKAEMVLSIGLTSEKVDNGYSMEYIVGSDTCIYDGVLTAGENTVTFVFNVDEDVESEDDLDVQFSNYSKDIESVKLEKVTVTDKIAEIIAKIKFFVEKKTEA